MSYGLEYTPSTGFSEMEDGVSVAKQLTARPDKKPDIAQVDFSTKFGSNLEASFGPELILSLLNIKEAYQKGFDGLALTSIHPSFRWRYKLEASQNPDLVVEHLNAPAYGINKQDATVAMGPTIGMRIFGAAKEEELASYDIIEITISRLPDFEIEYKDKEVGSKEFEVSAENQHWIESTTADIVTNEIRWHVIEPDDATLVPRTYRLSADGKWAADAVGDSYIVFEYTPDTIASMVSGVSEITKTVAKQYVVFQPQFLLEGIWNMHGNFGIDTGPNTIATVFCILGDQSVTSQKTFNYDAVKEGYFQTTKNAAMGFGIGVGALISAMDSFGGSLENLPHSFWSPPYDIDKLVSYIPEIETHIPPIGCYELEGTPTLPPGSDSEGKPFMVNVPKYMNSTEFKKLFKASMNKIAPVPVPIEGEHLDIDINIINPDKFVFTANAHSIYTPFLPSLPGGHGTGYKVNTVFTFDRVSRAD